MGATNFIEFQMAETANAAFDALVQEAVFWYGHDPYNGTISTTRLVGAHHARVAEEWSEDAREAAIEAAEADGWGKKYESRCIDCGRCGDSRMWAFYGWAAC